MKKQKNSTLKKPLVIALIIIVLIAGIYITFKKPITTALKKSKLKGLNVILITLDTMRTDHLSCYSERYVQTPNLDAIAREGVIFNKCISQVPLTLPAHTSILSGTYPFYHRVRDNGGFVVPIQLTLISEILKEQEFKTSAFIAAFVLHSKWGLNQGFDLYSDALDTTKTNKISLGEVQKRAGPVLHDAREWISEHNKEKFFCWIHLYDPHTPYDPPSPFNQGVYEGHPYRGEVAYMDHELGLFFEYLKTNKISDNTLLIIVGDHGESLGEHQESTHGFFIYHSCVWVPLIIKAPFVFPVAAIDQYVEHTDIVPTILEALKIPIPPTIQGKSLLPLMFGQKGEKENMAYTETYYPRQHFGWSELKGLYRGEWKYIQAPGEELYNINQDTLEQNNLILKQAVEKKDLRSQLIKFVSENSRNALSPAAQSLDEKTRKKLATLGYLSTTIKTSTEDQLPDPKNKIDIYNNLALSKKFSDEQNIPEAIKLLKSILAQDPEIIDAYMFLGNNYFVQRNFPEALKAFRTTLDKKPDYNFAMINIINTLINLGRLEEAQKECLDFLKIFPGDTNLLTQLGETYFIQKNYEKSYQTLVKAIESDASNGRALNKIGEIFLQQKNMQKAREFFHRAQKTSPSLKNLNFNLGFLAEVSGKVDEAISSYEKELTFSPRNMKAAYNLAEIYRKRSDWSPAIEYYQKCIQINPRFNIPYFMIAKIHFDLGTNIKEATNLCLQGVNIKPIDKYTAFGYYILADIFANSDKPKATLYLDRAKEIMNNLAAK